MQRLDKDLFYGIQRLCIDISGAAIALEPENIRTENAQYEWMIPEAQQTPEHLKVPLLEDEEFLHQYITKLCNKITDKTRAIYQGRRHSNATIGELEAIYQEIEVEQGVNPPKHQQSSETQLLHGYMDLLDDLETLSITLTAHQNRFDGDEISKWQSKLSGFINRIEEQQTISVRR